MFNPEAWELLFPWQSDYLVFGCGENRCVVDKHTTNVILRYSIKPAADEQASVPALPI